MTLRPDISQFIQSHKAFDQFDYNLVVEWAFQLMKEGNETENVLILASFSQPIDSFEIRPYVTAVLRDLGLEELKGEEAIVAKTHYHLTEILAENAIRKNLHSLCKLCIDINYEYGLYNFYLLDFTCEDLKEYTFSFHYDGVNRNNFEQVLKKEARQWIEKYYRM
jgi:hypothetical protein